MIKKLCDYILRVNDKFLLVAIALFVYGCSNHNDEKKAVDWNGFNYGKICSDDGNDSTCEASKDSAVDAIGKGGKR